MKLILLIIKEIFPRDMTNNELALVKKTEL